MPYSYIGALGALSPENSFSEESELELTPALLPRAARDHSNERQSRCL